MRGLLSDAFIAIYVLYVFMNLCHRQIKIYQDKRTIMSTMCVVYESNYPKLTTYLECIDFNIHTLYNCRDRFCRLYELH